MGSTSPQKPRLVQRLVVCCQHQGQAAIERGVADLIGVVAHGKAGAAGHIGIAQAITQQRQQKSVDRDGMRINTGALAHGLEFLPKVCAILK